MKKAAGYSILLGFITSTAIAVLATELPYSSARDRVVDALALPGALLASLIYPQGVHTGHGASFWGVAVVTCNFAVYVLFWFVCLNLWIYFFGDKGRHDASSRSA